MSSEKGEKFPREPLTMMSDYILTNHKLTKRNLCSSSLLWRFFEPPVQMEIITLLSGNSLGTQNDAHDVPVHADTHLADDPRRYLPRDADGCQLVNQGVSDDPLVLVYGGKSGLTRALVCPVAKKVAKTDITRGGRWAAALTTPYLSSAHDTAQAGDLNVSLKTQGGRGRRIAPPKTWTNGNWFSITKDLLPAPARHGGHDEWIISVDDQKSEAGSWFAQTGSNYRQLAVCGVDKPLGQAVSFLQASQLGRSEADRAKVGKKAEKVVSVVFTTFLPLLGQRHIGR